MSKIAIQDVEALQRNIKTFIETYVISELLCEGGYEEAMFDSDRMVYIKFGAVDKEEKIKVENQIVQLWLNNLISETEARTKLGERPLTEEDVKKLHSTLAQERIVKSSTELNTSNNISKPANQHGERSSPKLGEDSISLFEKIKNSNNVADVLKTLENY